MKKISLDAASLCDRNNRFGTHTFTENLIRGLGKVDQENNYTLYSFCRKPNNFTAAENMRYRRMLPKKFWMTLRVGLEEVVNPKDYYLALNQAMPFFTRSKILSFSHGLSYYFFKDLYRDSYDTLKNQLFTMVDRSTKIFLSSKRVKDEMESIFMKNDKFEVLPFGIPYDMITSTLNKEEVSERVTDVPKKFFLFAGVDHPIKNVRLLLDAFTIFLQNKRRSDFHLVLVGSEFEDLPKSPNVLPLKHVSRSDLKYLYQKASGYLTASLYESFNFPVLEALSQGCPVIGKKTALIPELLPYTYCVETVEEFVEAMNLLANETSKKIPKDELRKKFSWDEYANKIVSHLKD